MTYKTFKTLSSQRIRYIKVLNTKGKISPAEYLIESGIDYDYVKIIFKSQKGHGIHYMIQAYGQ